MLKYIQLKEDDSSVSPDDESLEVSSLSASSSTSLADSQGHSRKSSRSSPTLISYTPLSPTPSSSSSRSSSSSNSTPLSPTSSVSSGSASPWSTSSSEPLATTRRRKMSLTLLSSPSSSSPPSLESALLGLAKTAIAPSKILADPLEKLVERRNELMSKLIATVGSRRRANNLFVNHAQQWHYLLVYAEEDATLGTKLRRILETYEHVTVAGPWEVRLGDQRLDVWQRLLESSTVVLVLLSRALLRDEVLGICFPGTLIRRNSVVPLFVEPLEAEEITPSLKPIIHRSGEKIYRRDWNAKSYLQALHKTYTFDVHYDREVFLLEQLLEEIRSNVSYVCRCGNC